MLVKFESKSNRVKGIAFHPKRQWILASLHNGIIQLWDYRMEVLIHEFEEHDGPVRGVNFHITQPLFVSGGDDYKIKIWNYQSKRCLFNLLGHLDYIRTVKFHHSYPWVLSASDDQTMRIWNWQSRVCLTVLTGHNHYVMCAQFHPKEDLVLSASLDQTVRVWDMSGLRKKNVSIASDMEENSSSRDLFGASDVVVKHVLEGHSRGVNWASFHPTQPLIASGADDREVKLWRMNDAKAREVDTLRGHINNVSCVLFHPKQELLISNSEDKSIRVWDTTKQASPVVHRRENDRYWILDTHPTLNLLAAGHDTGMVIFKLSRERPPFAVNADKTLIYYKDHYIYEYNFKTGNEKPILSTRRNRTNSNAPRILAYNMSNRSQHNILLCSDAKSTYSLYVLSKNGEEVAGNALRGSGKSAVFVSSNRFAVLDKSRQIWLKNLKNESRRKINIPNVVVNHIFSGGIGRLLFRTTDSIILYDVQSLKIIAELPTQSRHPIKYVSWSADNKLLALFSKACIYITNSQLQELCTINENSQIKSGAWDPIGVFVYVTATHIKYVTSHGDSGIIRTLEVPVYVTLVKSKSLFYLDREAKPGKMEIDTTEYQFKVALMKRKNKEVLRIMQSKKLIGQAIIGYLQQKGFPEVALHFVEDNTIKFSLALECGNIAVALSCAAELDKPDCWHKLGVEALRQGNHQVVEAAYQKTKNFERLSFLYLITGNTEKLGKMLHIAGLRGDAMARYHNALFLGNVAERIQVLRDVGQHRLAYLTAETHGMEEEAAVISEELGDAVPDLPDLSNSKLFIPPNPILRESNWPLIEVQKGFFDQMSDDEIGSDNELDQNEMELMDDNEGLDVDIDGWGLEEGGDGDKDEEQGDGGGWGEDLDFGEFGDDKNAEKEDDDIGDDVFVMPKHGKSQFSKWSSNSTLAADNIAAGSFDLAMHLLNRQIGVVNFEPLKQMFLSIYNSSRCNIPQLPGANPLISPLQRPLGIEEKNLPLLIYNIQYCVNILKKGYKAFRDGNFQAALKYFSEIIHTLPVIVVDKKMQVQEVYELRDICKEYIIAVQIAIQRRSSKNKVRQAQLSAYFTRCKLQSIHLILALKVAINSNLQIKNYKTTASFCRQILELAVTTNQQQVSKFIKPKQIRNVLKQCEKAGTDAKDIDFDESRRFDICSATMTAVYKGTQIVRCPYCNAAYKETYDSTLCRICQLSRIGSQTTGLNCFYDSSTAGSNIGYGIRGTN